MSGEDKQRRVLRRYLLGELPEAERTQLADKYFVDEVLFDELLDVENELLDQYVRAQLSPEERKNFGAYLSRLPDVTSKLATTYALMKAAKEAQGTSSAPLAGPISTPSTVSSGVPKAEPAPVLVSRWESLRAWLFGDAHFLRYAIATILITLAVGVIYLIVTERQLRRELEQVRSERMQLEQEKGNLAGQTQTAQQDQATLRDRNQQLEQELTQARRSQERQEEIQVGTRQPKTSNALLASLVLTPAVRSGGTPDVLTLSHSTKTVLLVMPVPNEEQIASYRAVLQTTGGHLVFRQERLRPQLSRRGRALSLRLPAARLPNQSYKLTLQGKAADEIEIAQDYYFNVVRK